MTAGRGILDEYQGHARVSDNRKQPPQKSTPERTSVTPTDKRAEADRRAEAARRRIRESDQMRRVLSGLAER
jgi:hypothetical protein